MTEDELEAIEARVARNPPYANELVALCAQIQLALGEAQPCGFDAVVLNATRWTALENAHTALVQALERGAQNGDGNAR